MSNQSMNAVLKGLGVKARCMSIVKAGEHLHIYLTHAVTVRESQIIRAHFATFTVVVEVVR